MRNKKLLLTAAVLSSVLLVTGCTTQDDGKNNGKDDGSSSEIVGRALVASDFQLGDKELESVPNMSAYFDRFGNTSGTNVTKQLIAASTISFLDSSVYNPYFIADWWGEKDKNGEVGLKHLQPYVSSSLMKEMKTLVSEKEYDKLGAKFFFNEPEEIQKTNIKPNSTCFEDWEAVFCYSPTKKETFEIVTASDHHAVVKVKIDYTAYVNSEFDEELSQPVTYEATLTFKNNPKLTDVNKQPFFVVDKIDGGFKYGKPVLRDIEKPA